MKFFSQYSEQIIVCIIVGLLLMENIDANVMNIALPLMAGQFHSTIFILKIAITSYFIALSIFIPISRYVSGHFGLRKTIILSTTVFTTASFFCGLSNSVSMLFIWRFLQGSAAGFIIPSSRLLLLSSFPKTLRVKIYSLISLPILAGTILAPVLGGTLQTFFTWRLIFFINLPIGIIIIVLSYIFIRNHLLEKLKFNITHFVCFACLILFLYLYLEFSLSNIANQSIRTICLPMIIIIGFIFFQIDKKSTYPLFNYDVFKIVSFRYCFFISAILFISLGGRTLILSAFLESIFHLSSFKASLYFLYIGLGVILYRVILGKFLLKTFSFKKILIISNLGSALSLIIFANTHLLNYLFCFNLCFMGFCVSAQLMNISLIYTADINKEQYNSAVSIISSWQQLSLALGIMFATTILKAFVDMHHYAPIAAYHKTFLSIAVITLSCQIIFYKFKDNVGSNLM